MSAPDWISDPIDPQGGAIEIIVRRKDQVARWWHRPITWIQQLLVGSRFALMLSSGRTGWIYFDRLIDRFWWLVPHEIWHVVQAIREDWFRTRYVFARAFRMRMEAEAYAIGFRELYRSERMPIDVVRCQNLVIAQIEHVARAYALKRWLVFGDLTNRDKDRIRQAVHGVFFEPLPPFSFTDQR